MKKIVIVSLLVLLLTSCVHKSPFEDEYYFQAMGGENDIVMTLDVDKVKETKPEIIGFNDPLIQDLVNRANRLSISLYTQDDTYPALFENMNYYGAFEGNYDAFLINTGMRMSSQFYKEKTDDVYYYTDGELKARVIKNGIFMFSNDDFQKAYKQSYEDRVIYIAEDTAKLLGDSVIGLYVRDPNTMIDLGFDLPLSVIMKMSDAIIYIIEKDGSYFMNADIKMESKDLAGSLLKTLRTKVMGDLKREGIRPDTKVLMKQYYSVEDLVHIRDVEIRDEVLSSFTSTISNLI